MTPKTEAASLGEQIKGELLDRVVMAEIQAYAETREAFDAAVNRLVALATSEPPAPQPVAQVTDIALHQDHEGPVEVFAYLPPGTLLYAQQPAPQAVGERLPLTDDDLWDIYRKVSDHGYRESATVGAEYKAYARAIEAAVIKALKEPT